MGAWICVTSIGFAILSLGFERLTVPHRRSGVKDFLGNQLEAIFAYFRFSSRFCHTFIVLRLSDFEAEIREA